MVDKVIVVSEIWRNFDCINVRDWVLQDRKCGVEVTSRYTNLYRRARRTTNEMVK